MAPLTDDDRVLIRILRTDKGFNAFQMIKEFPNRGWNKRTLNRLIQKIRKLIKQELRVVNHVNRLAQRAQPLVYIARVSEIICSQDTQDDDPGTSKSHI